MVRSKVKSRDLVLIQPLDNMLTSMILCVVKNDQSIFPPIVVLSIQMVNKFAKEESKREAIGLAEIATVEDLVVVADPSDDVKLAESLAMGDQVVNTFDQPTSPPRICGSEVTFIDVDDSQTSLHSFDVLCGCILPLELGSWIILVSVDLLDRPIGDIEL